MRKLLLFILVTLSTGIVWASIETVNVQNKLADLLRQQRNVSASCSTQLKGLKSQASDIITDFGGAIDSSDKTAINSLTSDVDASTSALDGIVANIDTNFASVK